MRLRISCNEGVGPLAEISHFSIEVLTNQNGHRTMNTLSTTEKYDDPIWYY